MNETLANVSIVAATIGTVTFLLPQIIKLTRTHDSAATTPPAAWSRPPPDRFLML